MATLPALDARCLIITGEGSMFSAGYDIGDPPASVFADEPENPVAHPFAAAIDALEAYPYPIVAALNGHAIGGGLELATEIAGHAPLAQVGNKRVIRAVLEAQAALDPETERELLELRRACFSSEDFREGVRAFAERRTFRWQGR